MIIGDNQPVQVDPENMAKHEIAPLLEIQLELVVPEIVWIPELGSGNVPGVRDMFNKWFKSFLEVATLIKRLDTGEGQWLLPCRTPWGHAPQRLCMFAHTYLHTLTSRVS